MDNVYQLVLDNKEWLVNEQCEFIQKEITYNLYFDNKNEFKKEFTEFIDQSIFEYSGICENKFITNCIEEKLCFILCDIIKRNLVKENYKTITIGILLQFIKCFKSNVNELIIKSSYEDKLKIHLMQLTGEIFDCIETTSSKQWYNILGNDMKFNALAEIATASIFIYDENGFIYVNPAMEKITSYTENELHRIKFDEIVHPEYKDSVIPLLEGNEKYKGLIFPLEFKIIAKDGEERWISYNEGIITLENKKARLGVAFDISKRIEIQENFMQSEKQYRDLLELMPDAVIVQEKDTILYANKAAANIFGVEKSSELFGMKKYELLRSQPKYASIMMQQDDRLLREKTLNLMDRRFIRLKDGKMLILETTATVTEFYGKQAILYIIRNVEERKKIEKLKQNVLEKTRLLKESEEHDKIKNEFFANISHELRTPLNVLLGALQLLELIDKKESLDKNRKKIEKYYSVMKQNCFRLVRLVNNLIDITKIDAGYFQINPENINIVSIIENITLSVVEYAESKGIILTFDTDVEEKIMFIDPDSMERIILNLLSNSLKFTESGGKIDVSIKDMDDKLIVSVRDTGIGIPKDKLKDIFKRFVQVDKSLSRNNEGSGIGLSLVKSLVEMQNGKISIQSEYGKGSEITIELPVKVGNGIDKNKIIEYDKKYIRQSNIERINIEFSDIYS